MPASHHELKGTHPMDAHTPQPLFQMMQARMLSGFWIKKVIFELL
ncbi:MAG: hypothetical protein U0931_29035 [Vulcanimicrobiota bacterium]